MFAIAAETARPNLLTFLKHPMGYPRSDIGKKRKKFFKFHVQTGT